MNAPCETCPFNDGLNEAATIAQNYGCLPTAAEIVAGHDANGSAWMCHSNEQQHCAGLAQLRSVGTKPVRYSEWYRGKSQL